MPSLMMMKDLNVVDPLGKTLERALEERAADPKPTPEQIKVMERAERRQREIADFEKARDTVEKTAKPEEHKGRTGLDAYRALVEDAREEQRSHERIRAKREVYRQAYGGAPDLSENSLEALAKEFLSKGLSVTGRVSMSEQTKKNYEALIDASLAKTGPTPTKRQALKAWGKPAMGLWDEDQSRDNLKGAPVCKSIRRMPTDSWNPGD